MTKSGGPFALQLLQKAAFRTRWGIQAALRNRLAGLERAQLMLIINALSPS